MILRFITVLFLLGGVAPPTTPVSGLSIALDPGRLQLMKDALSWMTFRREGKLASAEDLEQSLFYKLKDSYSNSKFYRTFVIAFQHGVLPKLTLNEGDACDPDKHVWKWRSPHNHSITWLAIRNFTFESYYKRGDPSLQFCDYRQGLMCSSRRRRCECRVGSSMSPVEPGSSVRRCLLNEGQVCAIVDFDQGAGPRRFPTYTVAKMMVFNPMKPEGCKPGLQCRVTQTETDIAKCHGGSVSPSEWLFPKEETGNYNPSIGAKCALNLITEQGACRPMAVRGRTDPLGDAPGLTCFNLGPPRSTNKWRDVHEAALNRDGFCSFELGPWQMRDIVSVASVPQTYLRLWLFNFVMGFVHSRTVPLTPAELEAYYARYLAEVQSKVIHFEKSKEQLVYKHGEPCNVAKTEKMADIWSFYAGLEEDPLPGQDFVATATKKNLDDKLQELVDLVNLNDGKICKVYWSHFIEYGYEMNDWLLPELPPLKCVKNGTTSGNNDGFCQNVSDVSTKPFSDKVQELSYYAWYAWKNTTDDENEYDQVILNAHPELPCVPKSGTSKRSLASLEDGSCPGNSVCLLNYNDDLGIYDQNCKLNTKVQLRYDCHDITGPGWTGPCERRMRNQQIATQVEQMSTLAELGRGKVCRHSWEKQIRDGLANGQDWSGNKHKLLAELTHENTEEPGNFCDRRRLLECTAQNTCECVDKTAPRITTVAGVQYESDYCYLAEGPCDGLQDLLDGLPLTQAEGTAIRAHYGSPDKECSKGNTCVFVDLEAKLCTKEPTGSTGHDLKPGTKPNLTPAPIILPPPKPYGGAEGIHGRAITGLAMLAFLII